MVIIIMNTSPQNLSSATPSETEQYTRTHCWSDGDSRIRKEESHSWRQRWDSENWASAQIKTRGHSDDKTNPTLWSASSVPPAPDILTGPGLFPPTQSTLPYSLVSFLLSAVLVPPTSPKYPNHSSLYSAQNELCKAGASQLVLVLLMLFLSKCLVKSVQVCQSCFSKQTTSLVRTPCVLLVLKSPTEMTPRDIFILI